VKSNFVCVCAQARLSPSIWIQIGTGIETERRVEGGLDRLFGFLIGVFAEITVFCVVSGFGVMFRKD